jgi:uncharacterized Zn-finger protein
MPAQPVSSYPVGEPANAMRRYEVTEADLPLACPLPEMTLWNSHPRVYLPIADLGGEAVCPYCGSVFVLKRSEPAG